MAKPEFVIIGITEASPWKSPEEEARIISFFLETGAVDIFHIRKNEASNEYTESLLNSISSNLWEKLVLHSNYDLAKDFELGGIHYKEGVQKNMIQDMVANNKLITASCHFIGEINVKNSNPDFKYSYVFLSPVFNSISKRGYKSAFSLDNDELKGMNMANRVIALGGVRPAYIQKIYDAKFAGAALLGYLWSPKLCTEDKISALLEAKNNIKNNI